MSFLPHPICFPYVSTRLICICTRSLIEDVSSPNITAFLHGKVRITPSNATKAIAFAGNALRKHGTNPRQYPLHPRSLHTARAASFQLWNCLCPSLRAPPIGSVIRRCFTTSEGYDVSQKIWAEIPPAQKLIRGADMLVLLVMNRVRMS